MIKVSGLEEFGREMEKLAEKVKNLEGQTPVRLGRLSGLVSNSYSCRSEFDRVAARKLA